jgi:cytochrome c553
MRKVLKWTGIVLGSLLILILVLGGVMYFVGGSKLSRTYAVQTADLVIPTDSASIARGAHLARVNGCTDCHAPNLAGQVFVDAPPFRIVASNLTPGAGGVGGRYSAADFDRAIRHGLRPDGSPLIIMPSAAFHRLADEDAAALIAYLQQVPPVDHELPATEVRAPGRIMSAFLLDPSMEVRVEPARATRPAVGPTAEYGEYLVSGVCAYCHGDDLQGAQPPNPDSPPAPPLAAAARWSLEEFEHALRTGETPGGRQLNPEFMPISFTSQYDDVEIAALHAHLTQRFGVAAQTASAP